MFAVLYRKRSTRRKYQEKCDRETDKTVTGEQEERHGELLMSDQEEEMKEDRFSFYCRVEWALSIC